MLALRAVEPDRRRAVDHHGVGWHLGCPHRHGLEAGEEARGVRHDVVDGNARLGEGGLGDGVVASHELELDHVAHGGLDVVGAELEHLARGVGHGDDVHGGGTRAHGAARHTGRHGSWHALRGNGTTGEEQGRGDGVEEMHL